MADPEQDPELQELEALDKKKAYYGWDNKNPEYLKRRDLIMKKYLNEAKALAKTKIGDDNKCEAKSGGKAPSPKFADWLTVKTINAKDFDSAYTQLDKHVAKGIWKSDIYTRGGEVTYKKEKCTWRRRMTKDGKNFARVIEYKGGYVLQKGVLALGEEEEEEEEEEEAAAADDGDEMESEAVPPPAKALKGKKRGVEGVESALLPEEPVPARKKRKGRK
jgi:hypothetical protein